MQASWCIIPDIVLRDNRLTANAKILFGKIVCISGQGGFCDYSNAQLSEEMDGLDVRTVQRYIVQLEACGYVGIDKDKNKRELHIRIDGGYTIATKTAPTVEQKPSNDFVATKIISVWVGELEKASEYWGVPYRSRVATPARMQKVNARLKELDAETIIAAIRGCVWNEFHIKGGFTDITLICRSQEKVEWFALKNELLKKEREDREDNKIAEFTG